VRAFQAAAEESNVRILLVILACFALVACTESGELTDTSGELTGKTWQWTGSTTQDPETTLEVTDPEVYTLVFLKGSFTVRADCNSVSGTWVSLSEGELSMTPTSSTDKVCDEGSLSEAYVDALGQATGYSFDGDQLKIKLPDEGVMTFE
jgi:heat shock protein HslJ